MYTQRAVWCAMLALSCLAATMSRRTRAQPAETAAVAMQPPQDAPEAQLSQLRAKYHLPMAAVAQLLGFLDGAGEADTKKAYQTLLAIRKRRNTHHSGQQGRTATGRETRRASDTSTRGTGGFASPAATTHTPERRHSRGC